MDSKEFLSKVIRESLEETASGANDFAEFKQATREAQQPFDSHGRDYNPNPRMGFIYHGTSKSSIESICQTGASGSKEFYGKAIGQVYGRGLYAMLRPEDVSVGDSMVEFAVKPGAFDNFIIFQHSYRSLLFKRGLLTRENESLGENIARLLDKDSLEMFRRAGIDLNRISHSTFMSYMTQGESRGGWRQNYGDETRLDGTKVDGFTIDYGGPAVVVRRMDILVPNRWRSRWDKDWHYCIESNEQFDKLNLYFDAHARVRGEYPDTSFNQKPSAGFILVGDYKKGNLVNLRTGEYFSPVPLKNCTGFSNVKEYGFNTATFTLGKTEYTLRTADDGKTVQVLFRPKGWNEFFELQGGQETFKEITNMGIDGTTYAKVLRDYGTLPFGQDLKAGIITVGDENRGNFLDLATNTFFSPCPLRNCTGFKQGQGGYNAGFMLGKNKFEVSTTGGLENIRVFYYSAQAGGLKEMEGGYEGFLKLINGLLAKAKKPINESFMQGSFDDFLNKEIPNTTTLYSRSNNMRQFSDDVKNGKNIYFYTCSKPENAKSMMQNGMTYEFTGTSNDSTTFQGIVAYGAFSLAAAERNMDLGYGNAIYKFVLKDDLSKYIIFDPRIREAFGLNREKLSDQVKRMCAGKTYQGRPLIDVLDYGLKHPKKWYANNGHLQSQGVNGLDHLAPDRQGDACAAFFTALRGEMKGHLNGATMYDEIPVHLMGIHGYIYNGGNHWDCICVRNYNALMPVAYVVSKGYGSRNLPRDEKGHIIWKKNEYMTQEWFDRMNDNVTARFQYAGEYADTPMNTKQSHGYTLVNGPQGFNYMDVKTHRHLLPIDVERASRFTATNGIPTARFTFAKSEWDLYVRDGRVDLVRNGQVIPGDKFLQLLQVMKQKGVLPATKKIHPDAIVGGKSLGVLQEAYPKNWEKPLRNIKTSDEDALNFIDHDTDIDSFEGANSNNAVEQNSTKDELIRMMGNRLPEREFAILVMLFGIKNHKYNPEGRHFDINEVGDLFGLTYERVRKIREVALRRLRDNGAFVNIARQMLAEGENRTKNKGLRGGIDNLKAQEGRLNMNSESFFTNPNAIEVFNKIAVLLMGDKKTIENGKASLLRLFEDDSISSRVFKDDDARAFAAFCVYGQKSPIKLYPESNKYYQITSKMVSPGSAKSTEKSIIDSKIAQKEKRDSKAIDSIVTQREEGMDFVEAQCRKYKNIYFKGNVIYLCTIDRNKHFTQRGREDWIELRRTLSRAGYVTTDPRLTRIKVKGESIICAYSNVDKKEEVEK